MVIHIHMNPKMSSRMGKGKNNPPWAKYTGRKPPTCPWQQEGEVCPRPEDQGPHKLDDMRRNQLATRDWYLYKVKLPQGLWKAKFLDLDRLRKKDSKMAYWRKLTTLMIRQKMVEMFPTGIVIQKGLISIQMEKYLDSFTRRLKKTC